MKKLNEKFCKKNCWKDCVRYNSYECKCNYDFYNITNQNLPENCEKLKTIDDYIGRK